MEDLGEKAKELAKGWANLFSSSTSSSNPNFKGQGRKLGGEGGAAGPLRNPAAVPRSGAAAGRILHAQHIAEEEKLKRQQEDWKEAQRQRWAGNKGAVNLVQSCDTSWSTRLLLLRLFLFQTSNN